MTNLLGHEVERWPRLAGSPDVQVHLYGKTPARPGRKMGHANRVGPLDEG
jgi:5-(carboxyamino)imidazole ribonucleotide synthase